MFDEKLIVQRGCIQRWVGCLHDIWLDLDVAGIVSKLIALISQDSDFADGKISSLVRSPITHAWAAGCTCLCNAVLGCCLLLAGCRHLKCFPLSIALCEKRLTICAGV